MQLVGAIRSDNQHPRITQHASEKREQLASGPVSPVQVFEHQHDHRLLALALEQVGHRLVEPAPVVGRAACQGNQVVHAGGAHRLSQRRGERGEGQSVVSEVNTPADQGPSPVCARDQLFDEAGLADPGLTAHQDDAGLPRTNLVQGRHHRVQLVDAVHHRNGEWHAFEHATAV